MGNIIPRFGHGYLVMANNNQETLMNKYELKGRVEEAKGKVKEAKEKVKEAGDVVPDDKDNRRYIRTT